MLLDLVVSKVLLLWWILIKILIQKQYCLEMHPFKLMEYFMFSQEKSNAIWLIGTIFALAKATMTPIITNKHKTFVIFSLRYVIILVNEFFLFTPFLFSNLNWHKKWNRTICYFAKYQWSNFCLSNFEGYFGH